MRKPTSAEMAKIEQSRKMLQMGQAAERDRFTRFMPTDMKAARDMRRGANEMRESVDPAARDYELAVDSGYKKGGMVKKMANGGTASSRADGCAMKGKTNGMMVKMKSGGMC